MNYGASIAIGDVLYFVHADTFPPQNFVPDILSAITNGYDLGRYTTKFISNKSLLRINEWLTRFDFLYVWAAIKPYLLEKNYSIS